LKPRFVTPAAMRGVRLLLLDVDGVLTDGRLYFGTIGGSDSLSGKEFFAAKSFHVRDGFGIAMLHRAGIATGIISGRSEGYVETRAKELGMKFIRLGVQEKGKAVDEILALSKIDRKAAAYVGDDVIDTAAFAKVAVSIAVQDAHAEALASARFVTRACGGLGAVREVADALLKSMNPRRNLAER
jgi:3-deoxy-D-manno-octulosonate 8-phosphate phosphatase (KDO 8-P phosphatase)